MLILMRFSGCGARCLTRDHHSTVRPDKDRGWRGTTGQLAAKSPMLENCPCAVAGVAGCSQPQILDKTMSNRKHLVFAEVEKPLAATKGTRNETRDRCLLLLMFRHGLRVSETCGLQLSQVDTESRVSHVKRLKDGLSTMHPLRGDEIRAIKAWLTDRAR